jgi:hypothetical protein
MDRGLLCRSFSVVPTSEAFASLFLKNVFDDRQKNPLKSNPLSMFMTICPSLHSTAFYNAF